VAVEMKQLLKKCNDLYKDLSCCHGNGRLCNCSDCLKDGFYGGQDTYSCLKKLAYYTLNFGPIYASEIYHFLMETKLLNKYNNSSINILSLGAGFGPDLYGIMRYKNDNNLNINIFFTGIDKEPLWEDIRINNKHFETKDILTDDFTLNNYDFIFINKLFTTLRSIGKDNIFFNILTEQINNSMSENSYLIFNDINSINKGRDDLYKRMNPLFKNLGIYYFPVNGAYSGWNFKKIRNTSNIFTIPENLKISPKDTVNQSVFFVFKK